ncbi:MAG: hypothetical protein ACJ72W_11695 [Actinoallomurus sp.]
MRWCTQVPRNGHPWTPPAGDDDGEVSAQVVIDVAAGPVTDHVIAGLAQWIRERVGIRE